MQCGLALLCVIRSDWDELAREAQRRAECPDAPLAAPLTAWDGARRDGEDSNGLERDVRNGNGADT